MAGGEENETKESFQRCQGVAVPGLESLAQYQALYCRDNESQHPQGKSGVSLMNSRLGYLQFTKLDKQSLLSKLALSITSIFSINKRRTIKEKTMCQEPNENNKKNHTSIHQTHTRVVYYLVYIKTKTTIISFLKGGR